VTVSPRTLEKNGVELKLRSGKDTEIVPLDEVVNKIKAII
jgi:prolyl-tRNA synthetase